MIFTTIVSLLVNMITAIFGILPDVPPMPTAIIDGGTYVSSTVSTFVSFINQVFSPPLVAATVVVAIGLFTWEWFYHLTMWILRKIPIINIK